MSDGAEVRNPGIRPDKGGHAAAQRPLLVLLHGLGGSVRSWTEVIAWLGDMFDILALDLPGFGDNTASADLTVEQMVGWVTRAVLDRHPREWMVAGHSMGGKLATLVTARAETGGDGLAPPTCIVLVAASPPGIEPMGQARRAEMIGWCAGGGVSAGHAASFVASNSADGLPENHARRAAADVQRSSPTAWLAWLERGSLEDWAEATGMLRTPALIVAGRQDEALGEENQRRLNLPHYLDGTITVVDGAAHLIPMEQPEALARLIARHWSSARARAVLPVGFAQLLASDRVSARTRAALVGRLAEPPDDAPRALGPVRRQVLAAVLARVLPQDGPGIDLASRIDVALAAGLGDGWRFAALPADAEAWRRGLDTLADMAAGFVALSSDGQDGWIRHFGAGELGSDRPGHLTAPQMKLWLEDVRAEAVRTWLAHPVALARIGYDGFANGGDGRRKQGYLRTHADKPEEWQPRSPPVQERIP